MLTATTLPLLSPQACWQKTEAFQNPHDRWTAYLNHLAIAALLPWLQEEFETVKPVLHPTAQASLWSCTTGTAFTVDQWRWVLIPTESLDREELVVPREWIDIPDWVGDYYVAVHIDPDAETVEIWGLASHYMLKNRGWYDVADRTYHLNGDALIRDLATLRVRQALCPSPSREVVSALSGLSQEHAHNLCDRLATLAPTQPLRLALPFDLWAGLVSHGGWRQQIHQQRQGLPLGLSLVDWVQRGLDQLSLQLGWQQLDLQPAVAMARGSEGQAGSILFSRTLTIAGQPYDLQVSPQGDLAMGVWRFELRNALPGGLVPGGFCLSLLTEDLQPFDGNQAIAPHAVESLHVEVALEPKEGVVWEISPQPDGFEREILRF